MKQPYDSFSATIHDVTYHISAYEDKIIPGERVRQMIHKHFNMEFHYLFAGRENIETAAGEDVTVIRPGECAVIPQGIYHGVFTAQDSLERLCFGLNIEYSDAAPKPNISDYRPLQYVCDHLHRIRVIRDAFLTQWMAQYRSLSEQPDLFLPSRKGMLLLEVALRLLELIRAEIPRDIREESGGADILAMNRKWIIEEYIYNRYADPVGIAELAKELCLSERQTRNLIRREFGSGYQKLIVAQRMAIADMLVQKTAQPLEQIAQQVGYQSYSGFYMAYVQYYGKSPDTVRKEHAGA